MERHSFSSFIEQSFGPMKDLTQGAVTKHLLHMSAFLPVSRFEEPETFIPASATVS